MSADDRTQLATELALLTILAQRVKEEADARRGKIAETWAGGDRVNLEIPTDNPARPLKVGTIRADGGQGVARICDPAAWERWCLEHYAHNVTHQLPGKMSWRLDEPSRQALAAAGDVYVDVGRGFGRRNAAVAMMLEALELQGYTLTKRADVPEKITVQPSWEKAVLEATQTAGTPITPNGDVPVGVEFVPPEKAAVKPVVTIGKDEDTRRAFVHAHARILPALTGTITDTEETP